MHETYKPKVEIDVTGSLNSKMVSNHESCGQDKMSANHSYSFNSFFNSKLTTKYYFYLI